jgi:hypothetical protein
MLNKNDPLIGAVQEVMKRNQAERNATRLVNEKFGVEDRKALPHEQQAAWDAAYKQVISEGLHPNQQKLDVHEPKKDKLTSQDFKMLRAKKKTMEESDVTSPSSMGIKKPDYAPAGTTPDYAKPKTQTVNRAAKTSLPAGTMKEAVLNKMMKKLAEKKMTDAEMTKREEIAKSMKPVSNWEKRYPGRGKEVMYATATKQAMKEEKEGFNNRHGLSVTTSAEKQAVAVLNEAGSPVPAVVKKQQVAASNERMTSRMKAREPRELTSFERFQAREKENPTRVIGGPPVVPGPGLAGNIARVGTQALPRLYNYLKGGNAQSQVGQLAAGAARRPGGQQSVPMVRQTSTSTGSNSPSGPWGSIARRGGDSRASAVSRQQSAATRDTFQGKLAQARQTAQQGRVGTNTAPTAARARLAQQTQQGRVGTNTSGATQAAARITNRPTTPNAAGANAARPAKMQGNKTDTIPQVSREIGSPSPTKAQPAPAQTNLKPANVMPAKPSFEFSDKQREAAKKGKAGIKDVQAWAQSRGIKADPSSKEVLRNYLNAAQNKTMKTDVKAGGTAATPTQTAAQSAELKMKAGMAQISNPSGTTKPTPSAMASAPVRKPATFGPKK